MSEYSGLSKDDFKTLMESYEKDNKPLYINGSDNKVGEIKDSPEKYEEVTELLERFLCY